MSHLPCEKKYNSLWITYKNYVSKIQYKKQKKIKYEQTQGYDDQWFHLQKQMSFVTVNTRNACKSKFTDNFWLPFLDKPKLDVVVFKNLFSDIQKYCNGMDLWNIYKY